MASAVRFSHSADAIRFQRGDSVFTEALCFYQHAWPVDQENDQDRRCSCRRPSPFFYPAFSARQAKTDRDPEHERQILKRRARHKACVKKNFSRDYSSYSRS